MSRSASLCVNLLLTFLEVNDQKVEKEFDVVELTQVDRQCASPAVFTLTPFNPPTHNAVSDM